MFIGIGIGVGIAAGAASYPFNITITGLTDGEARIGDHDSIGYTITPDNGTETVAWGTSNDDDTFGTGAAPTDITGGDEGNLVLSVTDGGVTRYISAPIRYAPGSVTESSLSDWTIDDDTLNVNLASDFTTTNLTGSYVITGLPSGAVDDGDGTISGTADGTPETASITCTFTDQYGRTIVGSYSVDTVYRAQATGGTDLDLSFVEGTPTVNVDLKQNWTVGGNTLTYTISPALPTGFGLNSSTATLTRTGTVAVSADATYTLTGTDEYGRETTDTLTLEVTEASSASITISSAIYTPGSGGSGPSLATSVSVDGTTADYTLYGATHANGTTLSKSDIENGTEDAEDTFSIGPETLPADLDGNVSLSTSLTNGHLSLFVRDSTGTPVESAVTKIDSVNVDATAPTFSSGSPADNATDVAADAAPALTFSEDIFGVATKDFYLYEDIDTTPVLVETFTFDDATDATGDNGGSAAIVDDTITITPGANMAADTQHSIRWEAGAVTDAWGNPVAANTGDTAYNFTTAAVASLSYTRVPLAGNDNLTAAPSFTVDLSAASTGDRIVVFFGSGLETSAGTLNTNAMTKYSAASTSGGTYGGRMTVYEYVMTADGTASDTIAFTQPSSDRQNIIAAFITNGVIATGNVDGARGAALSTSVTPTAATNVVIGVAMGESGVEGFTSWVNVTEREEIQNGTRNYGAVADATNVSVAATTVGATPVSATAASDEDCILSVIVLEEAP
jgi:hypothetical protein